MLAAYLFALALGGVLLAVSLLGDVFDSHHHHGIGDADSAWSWIFSIRNATYFLFVTGGIGAGLTWARGGANAIGTGVTATVAGLAVAGLAHLAFAWVRRHETPALPGDDALAGLVARVVVPITASGFGKIEVRHAGRTVELLARPFADDAPALSGSGEVVIVEVREGTALVTPLSEPYTDPSTTQK